MVPEKQGLKPDSWRFGSDNKALGLSSGSRKTRIETNANFADAMLLSGV